MNIQQRLAALRDLMQREHLGAFIFPSTDAHQSEYVADHWKGREWISGFNGSAGTAVVTLNSAALWTDSRYFLAAEEQLKGTEFQLMKLKIEGTPTIHEWIGEQLRESERPEVGIDGMVCSAAEVEELIKELRHHGGITLRTNLDPLKIIWKDRPAIPQNKIEEHPLDFSGESCASKIQRIRRALRQQHADGMLMSALDDIAWTLNLRGTDVHCTPVFVSYLLISTTTVTLYTDEAKLTPLIRGYLTKNDIKIDDYKNVKKGLQDYFEQTILLDPNETSYTLMKAAKRDVVRGCSPVPAMKIMKNETEIKGYRNAMLRDGVAMVKFLKWLEDVIQSCPAVLPTEMEIDKKLTELRASQPLNRGLSFDTIAGYGEHGAIVHYEATPETDIPLQPKGLLLLDSGGQYEDGTTDITRTIALGPLTDEEQHIYTLVLKGHIALARAIFPNGSSGTQLDVLARQFMWREGLNYLHGTGHGVGSYLSVHEGPHQFRMEWKPQPLLAGMTITNEPGIYLTGKFGVRIENTMLIVPADETNFFPLPDGERPRYLQLEPLTLCPIDKRPIVLSMLTDEERQWLNDYHKVVYERLSPLLTDKERMWLKEATTAI
ncbi:aminopeptidase P family protein [Prevotella sp. E9-3]|uniref:aminopeptidase P family protein n=1 Tax=Prevotella sp. E9-3 TaxID=2913621 RepID=UPI001EDC54CC|nr:aminopeptidase P family protein [Prevotella sp. E9-3]UKK47932.1 aminopeptidase P family protein [Prevotella sp. E9-3]